jgi:hypothetical protein
MQIGSCRTARNSEHFSDFYVCESFYVMQHDDRPRSFRKLSKRFSESRLQLSILRRISERRLKSVAQLFSRPDLPAASDVECSICDNAIDPGCKALAWIESLDCLPRPDESILDRVFRVLMDRYDRSCYEVRTPLMQTNQPREGALVAFASRVSQRAFLIRDTHRAG